MTKLAALAGVLSLAAVPVGVQGQGWIEPIRPGPASVTKVRTSVRVVVRERVAHVEVEEWFRNDGGPFGEADYMFPLPSSASFRSYSLWQGDDELRGEMMEAAQARRIYEEIVRSKRDPALIELVGHGLVRARVFPIASGETRKILLRYTQVLGRAGDALLAIESAWRSGRAYAPRDGRELVRLVQLATDVGHAATADRLLREGAEPFASDPEVQAVRTRRGME
jgi:Ca-activated chloride channel family protein